MNSILPFTCFLLWLWLFPMDGKLIQLLNINNTLLYFVPIHSVTLFTISFFKKEFFLKISKFFIVLTTILTAIFPLFIGYHKVLLFSLGIFSAFFVVKATLSLKSSEKVKLTAAISFGLASVLQFLFGFLYFIDPLLLFFVISVLPLFSFFNYEEKVQNVTDKTDNELYLYASFVYLFYTTGGIMYSFIFPEYKKVSILDGIELFYYIVAIFIGYFLIKIDKAFSLLGGISCGLLAFSFFKVEDMFFYNISMSFLQAAFGFVEIFIVSYVLMRNDSVKAISIIFASMCLGITSGTLISMYLLRLSGFVVSFGNLTLVVASLVLLILDRCKEREGKDVVTNNVVEPDVLTHFEFISQLPDNNYIKVLRKKLSKKEFAVLELVFTGKTYKETAQILFISESTVKTYMKRIFEKEQVDSKDKLIEKILKSSQQAS